MVDYKKQKFAFVLRLILIGCFTFFQVKNVFSRFVPQAKEWFEVITKSKESPSPRSGPVFLAENNKFYLIGGVNRNHLDDAYLRDCWMYDCRKKSWERLGEMNELLYKDFVLTSINSNLPGGVVRRNNRLFELNIRQNKWTSYENPLVLTMSKITSSKNNEYLLYTQSNSNNNNEYVVKVQKFDALKEFKVGEYPIYQKISVFNLFPKEDYLWISLILNFLLFTMLFYIRRMHKLKFLQRAQKKLRRSDFTTSEWDLMCLIHRHGEMELSALNEYFNEEGLSYETLKKRRETFIKSIRIKIAMITRKPIEEILMETKHTIDKRMKIIHWNEDVELEFESDEDE